MVYMIYKKTFQGAPSQGMKEIKILENHACPHILIKVHYYSHDF
jgi:hypothetical protein